MMPTVSSEASFARFELPYRSTPAMRPTYRSSSALYCNEPLSPGAPGEVVPSEEFVIDEPMSVRITAVSDSQRKQPKIGPDGAWLDAVPAAIADAAVLLPLFSRDLPAARWPTVSTVPAEPSV